MTFRCPECGNDMLSLRVLNEEQQRLTAIFPIEDVLKCEVCNVFYEKGTLKREIFGT